MKKFAFCALALALAAPGATLAATATTSDNGQTQLSVRHSDLNLATPAGARIMIQRLENASANVCGASSFVSLAFQRAVRNTACYKESMDRAVASLASPTVNALYRSPNMRVASN